MSGFVGRKDELAALTAGLDDAFAGHGRLFLISGEPGIGKSRLAEELGGRARERGAAVLVGRCWEAGGAPPFWPWVQVIRARLRERDAEVLRMELGRGAPDVAQIVPELRDLFPDIPAVPSTESDAARFRLFDAVASFLRASSREQPLVLALDDVHAADDPSLLLLRFVAGQLADARVLVLSAYRDVDPTPSDPLGSTLAELVREPVTTSLPLRGLGEADIAGLIEVTTDQKPSARFVEALHAGTEGNPLFVGEIVRLLATEDRLGDAAESLVIPPSVSEVITRRLTRLSPECRHGLELASVLGRGFDVDVLERLRAADPDSLAALIEEAVGQRLLSDAPAASRQRKFSHVLVRDALYDGLEPDVRRELHLRALAVLEEVCADDPGPQLAALAQHAFAGGDAEAGIGYAQAAGDRALGLLAYEEAARLYGTGLAAVTDEGTRSDLLLALGRALQRSGEAERAKQAFLEAAELARRLGRRADLAHSALGYAGRFAWGRAGSDERMIPLLREGLAAAEDDLALRVRLLGRLAAAMGDEPDKQPREELSREAIDLARTTEDPATLAYALVARYAAMWSPDNQDERLEIADEIIELAVASGDDERKVEGHGYRFHALLELGDLGRSAGGALRPRRPDREDEATGATMDATHPRERRQPPHRRFRRRGRFDRIGHSSSAAGLQRLARAGGLRPAALRAPARAGPAPGDRIRAQSSARARPWRPLYQCALANLCVELGRSTEAARRLAALASDGFAGISRDGDWLLAMALLTETSGELGDVSSAAQLYELLSPCAHVCVGGWPEHPEAQSPAISGSLPRRCPVGTTPSATSTSR